MVRSDFIPMIMDGEFWRNHLLCGAPENWKGFRQMIKEDDASEGAAARAKRLTNALRGLLKEELREHGGTETFLRWIRSDDEKAV